MEKSNAGDERVFHARMDKSGRIVLPAEVKLRKRVKEGDTIEVREDARGELHLRSMEDVVRDVQDYFCKLIPAGVSLVDELIAERRQEAERE